MARFGDVGPYFPANVEIIRYEQNARDSRTNHPKSLYEMRSKQIGTGRGWTFVAGKYQVSVSKKYIGRFETVELAEAAYVQAAAGLLMSAECSNLNAGRNPASMESDRSKS